MIQVGQQYRILTDDAIRTATVTRIAESNTGTRVHFQIGKYWWRRKADDLPLSIFERAVEMARELERRGAA